MEEGDLSEAVFREFHQLQHQGVDLGSPGMVMFNLTNSIMTCPATLLLPIKEWTTGAAAHQVIHAVPTQPSIPDTTLEILWSCTKEHYGLTTATILTSAAGIPISKTGVGAWVLTGSSKTTNLASLVGLHFFPRTLIRQPTAARVAKATFGTVRVFGVIGRGIPFVAAGLAIFDLVSIGLCAYEAKNGR